MADLSITAANVRVSSGNAEARVELGEAVSAGEVLYLKTDTDGVDRWFLAQCDGTAGEAVPVAMALASGAQYQVVPVLKAGSTVKVSGAAYTNFGAYYYLSVAKGKVCPYADLVSTNKVTVALRVAGADTLKLVFEPTGLTLA